MARDKKKYDAWRYKWERSPKGRYWRHKSSASTRNIGWEFTFDTWWKVWEPHWERRAPNGLVMARHGDTGPYSPNNVKIIQSKFNNKEGCQTQKNYRKMKRLAILYAMPREAYIAQLNKKVDIVLNGLAKKLLTVQ